MERAARQRNYGVTELRKNGETDLRNYEFTEERDKRIIETTANLEIGRSFFT